MRENQPAAFGRLCVETDTIDDKGHVAKSAAFGRLCVETDGLETARLDLFSRLRAAVC